MAQKLEGESSEVTEVVEIPTEESKTTPPAANTLYPAYVRTLQEADEVLHRFENNTKSRFCVWRSPKDFGHSGMASSALYCMCFEISYKRLPLLLKPRRPSQGITQVIFQQKRILLNVADQRFIAPSALASNDEHVWRDTSKEGSLPKNPSTIEISRTIIDWAWG